MNDGGDTLGPKAVVVIAEAGFTDWIRDTWQDIEASRREYDAAEQARS